MFLYIYSAVLITFLYVFRNSLAFQGRLPNLLGKSFYVSYSQ